MQQQQQPSGKSASQAKKEAPEVADWVLQIIMSDEAKDEFMLLLVQQEIVTMDLLRSVPEECISSLDGFKRLKLGAQTAVKQALMDLRGSQPQPHGSLSGSSLAAAAEPPLTTKKAHVAGHAEHQNPPPAKAENPAAEEGVSDDLSHSSVGKLLTTIETLAKSDLTGEEMMFGHFTSEVALKGIRQKGFRVSKEGQGAGGFYLVSKEALEVCQILSDIPSCDPSIPNPRRSSYFLLSWCGSDSPWRCVRGSNPDVSHAQACSR